MSIKVLILCGGKGTRSYPFTDYFPKAMMPINGSPILVHLMKIYAAQGFTEFVLAAGHRKEMLFDYFDGRFSNWNVKIVDTGEDADTGERVIRSAHCLGDTFFATYADGLGDVNLSQLLETHRERGGLATLTTVPLRSQYGQVVFDAAGCVQHFEEKPVVQNHWINAGFFVFERRAFEQWKGRNLESGFWKSMDTSKDQQELERIYATKNAPWMAPVRGALAAHAG
jgi:glucose-1-phosphate cytidylyltransferase